MSKFFANLNIGRYTVPKLCHNKFPRLNNSLLHVFMMHIVNNANCLLITSLTEYVDLMLINTNDYECLYSTHGCYHNKLNI